MNAALKLSNWAMLLLMSGAAAAQEPPARSSAQLDAGEPRATLPATAEPPRAPVTAKPAPPARPAAKTPGAADRLNLGTATVTGDREQPKVMYIVPWKGSNLGDLSGKPMNSLLDEALAPVDRDEFKREVAYFDAVRSNKPEDGAANPAAKQGER